MCPKIEAAVSFLDANLHRQLYLAEVAQHVSLSPSRLCHLFKTEVMMPMSQYLKQERMKKACHLLETSFEPIKTIAFEVGYNDPTHFEREFKRAHGMTPLQYRASYLARLAKKKESRKEKSKIL